jgi:hypothetical protein
MSFWTKILRRRRQQPSPFSLEEEGLFQLSNETFQQKTTSAA